ncbi:PAS domain S-box protein [Colwelliaceae bacterium 6441]
MNKLTPQSLEKHLKIYEDKTGQLTITTVSTQQFSDNFKDFDSSAAHLGFSKSTFWFKFTIKNNADNAKWFFKNNNKSIQFFDFYTPQENGAFSLLQSGFLKPIAKREVNSNRIIFPLLIKKNHTKTYFIKVKTTTPLTISFSLLAEKTLLESELSHKLITGIFLGVMFVLLLVNIFFFYIFKIKSQLYLVLYIFSVFASYGIYDGIFLSFLPENYYQYATLLFMFCNIAAIVGLFLYFDELLLNKFTNKLYFTIKYAFFSFWSLIILLLLTTTLLLPHKLYIVGVFIFPFLGLFYSGYAWLKKQYHARFIFIGLCFLNASYLFYGPLQLGIFRDVKLITIESSRIGVMMLATLLSIAIMDYVRKLKKDQDQASKKIKAAEERFSQIFEQSYEMLFVLSTKGVIKEVNTPTENFLSKPKTKIINKNFSSIFRGLEGKVDQTSTEKKINQCLTGEVSKQNITVSSIKGLLKNLEISYQPLISDNNKIVSIIAQVRDITKQTQTLTAIQDIVKGIAGLSSENFFKNLLNEITRIYHTNYVMISLLDDSQPQTATSIVFTKNNQLLPNITFLVKNSPCEILLKQHLCNYPNNVSNLFPHDEWLIHHNIQSYLGVNIKNTNQEVIGFLSIMDNNVLMEDGYFIEILDVFAARVAHELKEQKDQQALQQALDKVDFHITNTPLAVIEWDPDFTIVNWNKAAEKIFGFTLQDFHTKDALEILVPENQRNEVYKSHAELLSNKKNQYNLHKNLTLKGNVILCEWYNTPLLDENEKVIGIASLVNDVTAEHDALNSLYLKEQEQAEIFNALIDAIFIFDHTGVILSVNNTVTEIFGYTAEQLAGKKISSLLPQNNEKLTPNELDELIKNKDANIIGVGKDIFGLKKDGEIFPLHLHIAELPKDKDGNIRFIGTCHDLTIFQQQQETIKQSQKMDALGNLTGGIAHDFNNLLGIINGYSELLAKNLSANDKLSKYTQHIQKASYRGAKLTQKLLSFASKNIIETEEVNINNILLDEFDMLQKTITPRIHLTYSLDENLPKTSIDKAELEDCILNLTINAMHAIPENGEINISTQRLNIDKKQASALNILVGDYVSLTIKDSGNGMDEATQQKALEPFFTTKGKGGTGLGLSQVYGFIERLKGKVTITSSLGNGCEIALLIPVTHTANYHRDKSAIQNTTTTPCGTVLVIDDEPALVELSTTILANAGYTVIASSGAEEALEKLTFLTVDIILCDVIMPNMGGLEFAKIVKEQYPNIPILFVSGYQGSDLSGEDKALVSSALKKPFQAIELLERIAKVLHNN